MRKGDGDLGMINSDMIISFSLSRRRRCRRVRSHQRAAAYLPYE
jgi:hypothetical protein